MSEEALTLTRVQAQALLDALSDDRGADKEEERLLRRNNPILHGAIVILRHIAELGKP